MNTTRFIRPFSRAVFRAPMAARPTTMVRPALLASQHQNKKTEVPSQRMVSFNLFHYIIPLSPAKKKEDIRKGTKKPKSNF